MTDPALRDELLALFREDQAARHAVMAVEPLAEYDKRMQALFKPQR